MRTTTNYKGKAIKQNSEHRFYVDRFNDEYDGMVMFTSEALERLRYEVAKHEAMLTDIDPRLTAYMQDVQRQQ